MPNWRIGGKFWNKHLKQCAPSKNKKLLPSKKNRSWTAPAVAFLVLIVLWSLPESLTSADEADKGTFRTEVRSSIAPQEDPEEARTPKQIFEEEQFDPFERPTVATQAVVLSFLSLFPFIVMILTSFMKIVIVLSLLRNALGVQQAPPNQIINGVALMLTMYVMYPTGLKMYDAAQQTIAKVDQPEALLSKESAGYFMEVAVAGREPLRQFLERNSSIKHQNLFYKMAYRILPEEYRTNLKPEDFIIIVPAYITSQLKDAFEIGVLIYIPFFVIDLVTSNILLAMGMMMLSPVTISMPLKLFLIVMLDGWTLLIEGLVATYR